METFLIAYRLAEFGFSNEPRVVVSVIDRRKEAAVGAGGAGEQA